MALKPEDKYNKCPTCDNAPQAQRYKGGDRQLVCGNGHNWSADLKPAKERKEEYKGFYIPGFGFKP